MSGRITAYFVVLGIGLLLAHRASAAAISLTNGTADFSQSSPSTSPDNSVNGVYNSATGSGDLGWAIAPIFGVNHVAAWNTTAPIVSATGSQLTFTLHQDFQFPVGFYDEVLGHFRLSVTTDSTPLDGNDNSATSINALTWTQLTPISATAVHRSMAIQGDNSILVSGPTSTYTTPEVFTVVANTALSGITAIRLEALTDPSLPGSGPGFAGNPGSAGNFVLTEITLDAMPLPEPASVGMLAVGGLLALRRRDRRAH